MTARETILSRIRTKIASSDAGVDVGLDGLTAGCPPDFSIQLPQPDYGFDIEDNKTERFIALLEQVHGTTDIWTKLDEVPTAVAHYLTKSGAELRAVITADNALTQLDWGNLIVEPKAATKSTRTSVTLAFAGIAETGTIAMLSSPESPVTLHFLPEINIVVLLESKLLATIEQLWQKIETQPRAINFITGPSKTGDIEQTIIYGAHGPKQFHVIIINK